MVLSVCLKSKPRSSGLHSTHFGLQPVLSFSKILFVILNLTVYGSVVFGWIEGSSLGAGDLELAEIRDIAGLRLNSNRKFHLLASLCLAL